MNGSLELFQLVPLWINVREWNTLSITLHAEISITLDAEIIFNVETANIGVGAVVCRRDCVQSHSFVQQWWCLSSYQTGLSRAIAWCTCNVHCFAWCTYGMWTMYKRNFHKSLQICCENTDWISKEELLYTQCFYSQVITKFTNTSNQLTIHA
jgi:hypothetical protein